MKLLNIWEMPFSGLQLIEASAGTGKTYTLANLYLRAVIGHTQTTNAKPLTVDQILVVTFTDAATEELKDRIRRRIADVRMKLSQKLTTTDDFIKNIASLSNQTKIIQRLLHAEQQMDEASIFTIHGFCNRVLKQYAFKSGLLFSCNLETNTNILLQQAVEDFWRNYMYNLPYAETLTPLIWSIWKTPEELLKKINSQLALENASISPEKLPETLECFYQQYVKPALELKQCWQQHLELLDLLEEQTKNKTKSRLTKLRDFLASDDILPDFGAADEAKDWDAYSSEAIENNLKKDPKTKQKFPPITHKAITKVDNWLAKPYRLQKCLQAIVLRDALIQVKTIFLAIKTNNQQMGFDDLLINLAKGLGVYNNSTNETNDNDLAIELRKQYPLAMIDEFQDTDSLQYNIFQKIYYNQEESLLMIGDPKQAIYAFRGADIFTYLQAKHEAAKIYNLDTNWRSSATMIDAVNTVFMNTENAFLFKGDIDFYPVKAAADEHAKKLIYLDNTMPALKVWYQTAVISKKDYQAKIANAVASEIARLLNSSLENKAVIQHTQKKITSVQQNDIAILVKDKTEANILKQALLTRGISSVYLSARDSIFDSDEAKDVLSILLACNSISSASKLKTALAASIFVLTTEELKQHLFDTELWNNNITKFINFQQLLVDKGPLVMIQQVIKDYDVINRLTSLDNGERKLTNLYHLSQLLATAFEEHNTSQQLIRWLEINMQQPNNDASEQQLHLENEQKLVKIITIHKSKGLEYPIVFIPFIASHWAEEDKKNICVHHDTQKNKTQISLIATEDEIKAQQQEQLAEKLRLLYVALTRAAVCCYISVAPVTSGVKKDNSLHETPIGYLLNHGKRIEAGATLENLLKEFVSKSTIANAIEITDIPTASEYFNNPQTEATNIEVQKFTGSIEISWVLTSYTALASYSTKKAYANSQDENILLTENNNQNITVYNHEAQQPDYTQIYNFPKGAKPGIFFHNLLENMQYFTSLNLERQQIYIEKQLIKFNYDVKWVDLIIKTLNNCLQAVLLDDICLAKIPADKQRHELNFCLSVASTTINEINSLIKKYDYLSAAADDLEFDAAVLQGMLRGAIDLIFEHNNCWYLVDYKTNWLGESLEAYNKTTIEQTMIKHRYDLQYQIYSLAMHRLLKQKLTNYDFDANFGGVFYLFIRGITATPNDSSGIFYCKPNKEFILELDQLLS
jgi:exodeoxyribonuclease V beta subunit